MRRAPKPEPFLKVVVHRVNAPNWKERYYNALVAVIPELRTDEPRPLEPEPEETRAEESK